MQVGNFPLKDKVVVVTGGGSGINAAFVKRAVDLGAKVVVADVKVTPEVQTFVDSNERAVYLKTDVSNWSHLRVLIPFAKDQFGKTPDVYVAGAGVWEPPWTSFWQDTEDERYASVDINISHVMKLTRLAMRALVSENRKGVVLSIASVGGLAGLYSCPMYIATKHAVVGFTKSMKLAEAFEGVKIVTICPGAVDTPLWDKEKRQMGSFHEYEALSGDDVAKYMVELVQEGKYGGGTVLEIMPNKGPKTRVVPEWNIDPPQGSSVASREIDLTAEIPKVFRPAKEIMDKERGTATS